MELAPRHRTPIRRRLLAGFSGPLSLVALIALGSTGIAQRAALESGKPRWQAGNGLVGANDEVLASAVFDGGDGPELYVGGEFTLIGTVRSRGIARWDGERWREVAGVGIRRTAGDTKVSALGIHDRGSGPELFAGGIFESIDGVPALGIAAWDGATWNAVGDLGTAGEVRAFASDGASLYVAGQFQSIGGVAASNVAVLQGGSWSPLGAGLSSPVNAITVATVAGVTSVYAAPSSSEVVCWNGSTWDPIPGSPFPTLALAPLDSVGNGMLLMGSTTRLLRWDGTSVRAVTDDAPQRTHSLFVDESGPSPRIFAGGQVVGSGHRFSGLAVWNGSTWSELGAPSPNATLYQDTVHTLAVGDLGDGERVFAGGRFVELAGGVAFRVAELDTTGNAPARSLETRGAGSGWLGGPSSFVEFDDGTGTKLYAEGGGYVGNRPQGGLVRLEGDTWVSVGDDFGPSQGISEMAVYDDGSGPAIHAIGRLLSSGTTTLFGVARWENPGWSDVGGGLIGNTGNLWDMAVYDDGSGSALYVGGGFGSSPTLPGANIARWDGTSWSYVGDGLSGGSRHVQSLGVHDDGTGAKLYAGGDFTNSGGVPIAGIARWDGNAWEQVGGGVNPAGFYLLLDIVSVDLPELGGPALVVCGDFWKIGGKTANGIAYWSNGQWSQMDRGFPPNFSESPVVRAAAQFDDGTGPALYITGEFYRTNDGRRVNHVARWDGDRWIPLGRGLRRTSPLFPGGFALASWRSAGGLPSLWIGGGFERAGAPTSIGIAEYSPRRVHAGTPALRTSRTPR